MVFYTHAKVILNRYKKYQSLVFMYYLQASCSFLYATEYFFLFALMLQSNSYNNKLHREDASTVSFAGSQDQSGLCWTWAPRRCGCSAAEPGERQMALSALLQEAMGLLAHLSFSQSFFSTFIANVHPFFFFLSFFFFLDLIFSPTQQSFSMPNSESFLWFCEELKITVKAVKSSTEDSCLARQQCESSVSGPAASAERA